MTSGIYAITSPSGKRYIGSAVNFAQRKREHLSLLRRGRHHCTGLQSAFLKYGEQALQFELLERVTVEKLVECEQRHIDAARPRTLYNSALQAGSVLGLRHSASAKARMSDAGKGRRKSTEHRAAISAALQGRTFTPEHKARVGAATRARKVSAEAREHMRVAQAGRIHSDASKLKRTVALLGRKQARNTSGFVGVTKSRNGRWQAYYKLHGQHKTVGTFDTPEAASAAREACLAGIVVADDLPA